MAKVKTRKAKPAKTQLPKMCAEPAVAPREFEPGVGPERASLIRNSDRKWVNGTTLHYCFLDTPTAFKGSNADKQKARQGFETWAAVGIGIKFQEVSDPDDAEIRIGFKQNDGHWSYVGRDVLGIAQSERTMNLDPGDGLPVDTAVHEIGHTLGFPHEHQNPNAGIVWDEQAVYDDLAGWPNFWSREKTFHNIIRKLDPGSVSGSAWDKNSIMHYPFKAGLILEPQTYRTNPLNPAPGLSPTDRREVKTFYPALGSQARRLYPFRSQRLSLRPKQQANFQVTVPATRSYTFSTFGESDTVMVLFEEVDGEQVFVKAHDDSGYSRNARFTARLLKGRSYFLRIRLYYQHRRGDFGVMFW